MQGRNEIQHKKQLVLIVDDALINLKVLNSILSGKGYEIALATNGEQALSLVQEISPDLILLDIGMPGLDGFEVCRTIKSSDQTKDIPIIFLTVKTDSESILKGFELGAVDYITKPFNSAELLSRVHTHLELRKLNQLIVNYYVRQLKHESDLRKKYEQENVSLLDELDKKNKIIEKNTSIDDLTKIYNHKFIVEILSREIEKARQFDYNLCVALLDIDQLAMINNNLGHLIGDVIISEIADIIKNELPDSVELGRYDGDEYLLVLPLTDVDQIKKKIENIRKKTAMLHIENQDFKVTISGSICGLQGENISELLLKVSNLLRQAKEKGGDSIEG